MTSKHLQRWMTTALVVGLTIGMVGACGNDDEDDDTPDEASFCRLALAYEPVAEAPLVVLEGLDRLAPDEVDPAVVVLRDAAEELDELEEGSADHLAAEFDIRFRPEFIAARSEVEAFIETECVEELQPRSLSGSDGRFAPGRDPSPDTTQEKEVEKDAEDPVA